MAVQGNKSTKWDCVEHPAGGPVMGWSFNTWAGACCKCSDSRQTAILLALTAQRVAPHTPIKQLWVMHERGNGLAAGLETDGSGSTKSAQPGGNTGMGSGRARLI